MALDEPKGDDEVVKEDWVTYLINKQLFEQVKPLTVDFVDSAHGSGFDPPSLAKGGSCGSCSC
jgi:Fe-S cluster assembly iron-binding protein IscA